MPLRTADFLTTDAGKQLDFSDGIVDTFDLFNSGVAPVVNQLLVDTGVEPPQPEFEAPTAESLLESQPEAQPFNPIPNFNQPVVAEAPTVAAAPLVDPISADISNNAAVAQNQSVSFRNTLAQEEFITPQPSGELGFEANNSSVDDPFADPSDVDFGDTLDHQGEIDSPPVDINNLRRSKDVKSVKVTEGAHRRRSDIKYNGVPASVRYNNPAAAYPRAGDNKYGLIGYGVLNGGKQGMHRIGRFPTPVHGGAANFDLFASNYTGLTLRQAVSRWRGNGGRGEKVVVPKGFNPNQRVTSAFLNNPKRAINFFRKMAEHETGSKQALSSAQWQEAWKMWKAGGAKNYEKLRT